MESLVFRGIVFNMSWEDPEMDRRAFRITPDDVVISITSAGCNPLNFLCQSPRKLISIDSNPAQTALLELKLAGIATLDHETFFDIFAARRPSRVTSVYRSRLRPCLSAKARSFWDKRLWMAARGVYQFGRMGLFCRILRAYLHTMLRPEQIDEFLDSRTLEEQRAWYNRHLAGRFWGPASKALIRFRPFMYLAGVHPRQFDLVDDRHDMFDYVKERIEYVLTQVPIYNNYFLSITVSGRFRGNYVPPYLLEENFETLKNNLDRVQVVNGWLGPYLDSLPPGSIHKFNLLDIFDWMTPEAFEATLHSVLRAAAPGATFIYRSGSYKLDPPTTILKHVTSHADLARELFATDRSATYGSFYVFSVNGKA
ncbi:MAG: hypothetical protein CHACPFDD_02413 [Phycisphaerae bacterium]|nr:hypothetical protein [Phycisphaerae bacterium]